MKPPSGNRPTGNRPSGPGGPSRPPSDRAPFRSAGGGPSRPPRGEGGGFKAGGDGPRDPQRPRFNTGGKPGGHDGPRPQRGHDERPPRGHDERPQRAEGPRPDRGGTHAPHRGDGARPRHQAPAAPERDWDTPRPPTGDAPKGTVWLYGHHAVAAALGNPARRIRRLLLTEEAEAAIAKHMPPPPWAVSPEKVDRARLDQLLGRDIVHQGAALLVDPLAPPSLQSVLERTGVIIVLDQVTDPRNVGAIMRSAAAFGAAAVITQDRNAPEETGGLAKAASGALETMPLLRAVNIARTIIALKAANVWCVGLDAGGKALSGPDFAGRRVALVLGAEGEGLRRLTRETCDEVAGLAMKGAVESLNVSAAASVALYELGRR